MSTESGFWKWFFNGEMLEDAKNWPRRSLECFCCKYLHYSIPIWFGPKTQITVIYDENEIGYCSGVKLGVKKIVKALKKARSECNVVYYKDVPKQCNELIQKLRWALFPLVPFNKWLEGKAYHAISPYSEVPEEMMDEKLVDLTCSSVKKVIETAKKWHALGYKVIIMGEESEWEPRIVNSHIQYEGIVVEYFKDVEGVIQNLGNKIAIIAQTSFSMDLFESNIQKIRENNPSIEIVVERTFCPAVERRIDSALRLAESCRVIIVVGDGDSNQGSYIRRRLRSKGVYCVNISDYQYLPWKFIFESNFESIGVVGTTTVSKNKVMQVVNFLTYKQCVERLSHHLLFENPCHGCPEKNTCKNVSGNYHTDEYGLSKHANACPMILEARNQNLKEQNNCSDDCDNCSNEK